MKIHGLPVLIFKNTIKLFVNKTVEKYLKRIHRIHLVHFQTQIGLLVKKHMGNLSKTFQIPKLIATSTQELGSNNNVSPKRYPAAQNISSKSEWS